MCLWYLGINLTKNIIKTGLEDIQDLKKKEEEEKKEQPEHGVGADKR